MADFTMPNQPREFSLALQRLTGLRHVELTIKFRGKRGSSYHMNFPPGSAPMVVYSSMIVNQTGLRDNLRPLMTRVENLENCRLVLKVDTEELRDFKGFDKNPPAEERIEDMSVQLRDDLLKMANGLEGEAAKEEAAARHVKGRTGKGSRESYTVLQKRGGRLDELDEYLSEVQPMAWAEECRPYLHLGPEEFPFLG